MRKLCTKEPFKAIGEVQYEYISIQPNSVLSVTLTPHTALGGIIRMLSSTFTAQRIYSPSPAIRRFRDRCSSVMEEILVLTHSCWWDKANALYKEYDVFL